MKKLGLLFLLLAPMTYFGIANAAETQQVGIVNLRQVIAKAPQVGEINRKLKAQFKPQEAKLQKDQKSIQKSINDLKRNASVMTKDKIQKSEQKIVNQRNALQKEQVNLTRSLREAQAKAMKGFLKLVSKQVAKVAKQEKLAMVFQKQALLYPGNAVDITPKVIKALS